MHLARPEVRRYPVAVGWSPRRPAPGSAARCRHPSRATPRVREPAARRGRAQSGPAAPRAVVGGSPCHASSLATSSGSGMGCDGGVGRTDDTDSGRDVTRFRRPPRQIGGTQENAVQTGQFGAKLRVTPTTRWGRGPSAACVSAFDRVCGRKAINHNEFGPSVERFIGE
jgi:hypothetical protein